MKSLQPLIVFAKSFILDVCTGFECVSGHFVLTETINLLIQWRKDKLKSNKLLLLDLLFYYFINKLMVPIDFFHDLIHPEEIFGIEKFL